MRKLLLRALIPLAGLVIDPLALADEKTPEAILAEKGLVRDGVTLILKADPRVVRLEQIEASAGTVHGQLGPLLAAKQQLMQSVSSAESALKAARERDEDADEERIRKSEGSPLHRRPSSGADRVRLEEDVANTRRALRDFTVRNGGELSRLEDESKQLSDEVAALRGQMLLVYRLLGADPEVKAAVRTINRTRRPRLVLGSVAGAEEYREILLNDDLALLREKGVIYKADRHRFILAAESEAWSLCLTAQQLGQELEAAESGRTGVKSKFEELRAKRQAVADKLARATDEPKQPLVALLEELDRQIEPFRGPEAVAREWAKQIASARAAFVRAVRDLRRKADAVPEARRAAEHDVDVHAALVRLNRGVDKNLSPIAEFRTALGYLKQFEATLQAPPAP